MTDPAGAAAFQRSDGPCDHVPNPKVSLVVAERDRPAVGGQRARGDIAGELDGVRELAPAKPIEVGPGEGPWVGPTGSGADVVEDVRGHLDLPHVVVKLGQADLP